MRKIVLSLLLILTLVLAITACSSPGGANPSPGQKGAATASPITPASPVSSSLPEMTTIATSIQEPPPAGTEFSRMLSYVPASAIEKKTLRYEDGARTKRLNQVKENFSLEDLMSYWASFKEDPPFLKMDWSVYSDSLTPRWRQMQLKEIIGFDIMGIDRIVYQDSTLGFSICEADFDEEKIIGLVTSIGYEEKRHGVYSYFDIQGTKNRDDETLRKMLALFMTQFAVLDNRIIISTTVDPVTSILDVMSGQLTSVTDNPAARIVADNLDNVLVGIITLPENLFDASIPYNFMIPADWGKLHQYTMVGMGYRNEGDQPYIEIILYYPDIAEARADGKEIEARVKSYQFYTQNWNKGLRPFQEFSDLYELKRPVVKATGDGAVLKLSFLVKRQGTIPLMGNKGLPCDVLFLAPDPAKHVAP